MEVENDLFLHVTEGGEELSFLRIRSHHSANYSCVAGNIAGRDSITYSVQVLGKYIEENFVTLTVSVKYLIT